MQLEADKPRDNYFIVVIDDKARKIVDLRNGSDMKYKKTKLSTWVSNEDGGDWAYSAKNVLVERYKDKKEIPSPLFARLSENVFNNGLMCEGSVCTHKDKFVHSKTCCGLDGLSYVIWSGDFTRGP